jgi:hypothetical protein
MNEEYHNFVIYGIHVALLEKLVNQGCYIRLEIYAEKQ